MIPRVLARLGASLIVLAFVMTGSFVLVRSIPGGPFDTARALPPEIEAHLRAAYDLDAPLHEQYARYVLGIVTRFDLGPSLSHRDYSVREVLAESLPVSVLLGSCALVFALALGLAAGACAAARRGSWIDTLVMGGATIGLALPNFLLAAVLILAFGFGLGWLPVAGFGTPAHLVLPAVALGLPLAASIARLFRAGLLDALGEDWVRTARSKGLSTTRVLISHAGRAALLPVVTSLGPAAAAVLTGSLVIEKVFAISGMGSHFVDSALNADYNLALGVILVYSALVSLLNLLADLVAALLDPRVESL